MTTHADVAVVGAGLARLACATRLAGAGLDVEVLQAGDAVGGRARTDVADGFLVSGRRAADALLAHRSIEPPDAWAGRRVQERAVRNAATASARSTMRSG